MNPMSSAAKAAPEERTYQMLIGGVLQGSSQWLEVANPATGESFIRVPRATPAQLEQAVRAAQDAFVTWSTTPLKERRERLLQVADRIHQNIERIAAVLTREQGKPLEAATQEVQIAEAFCRYFAPMEFPVEVIEDTATTRIEVHRKPLGVVAAITPWNFPFLIGVYKMAPAMLAGNTVIIKPAPTTPLTTLLLGELIRDVFPPGAVNTLVDDNDLGALLTSHPGIAKISFTGSTATGKKVMTGAASTLKRLTLELGGNDAAIVLEDADPKEIAPALFGAAFANSGQVCIAIKRLYVHESIYSAVCDKLVSLAERAVVGDGMVAGTQFGPLQNRAQYQKVCRLVEETRTQGNVAGESKVPNQPGYFVPITIVRDIQEGTRLVDEEQFGPVLPVIKYRNVNDVIARANASAYGLGGSVWSGNIQRAHEVALRLVSGTVWINQHLAFGPHIPLPGAKESGIGVEFGREGLIEYTGMQVINISK
jgi:acyl-CoA reductase-like NAD-dependent aldehyde dehydrogenase